MLVVVPSYNDRNFLEPLLESLFTEPAGAPFRVVVVSDFSTDGTEEWLATVKGIGVIRPNEKAYFTRACNAGLQYMMVNTEEHYGFLLNSDTVVTPGWAAGLISASVKLGAGVVGATLLNPDGTVQHAGAYGPGFHFGINKHWMRYRQDRQVPWVTGAAMCIRRDVIQKIGLLPLLPSGSKQYDSSDKEFCSQARFNGFEVGVAAGCVIYHYTHTARSIRLGRGDYTREELMRNG